MQFCEDVTFKSVHAHTVPLCTAYTSTQDEQLFLFSSYVTLLLRRSQTNMMVAGQRVGCRFNHVHSLAGEPDLNFNMGSRTNGAPRKVLLA